MGGGGLGPMLGIAAGALHPGPLTVLLVPVWLGITYATARYVYRRTTRKKAAELEDIANRLAVLIEQLVVVPHRLKP
jgi:hypothetical protein